MGKVYRLLGWANFGLLVAAALKFIPLLLSLARGFTLTTEQIAVGLAADRAWALDLISDTPYLLMVWLVVAVWLHRQTGQHLLCPWRTPVVSTHDSDGARRLS